MSLTNDRCFNIDKTCQRGLSVHDKHEMSDTIASYKKCSKLSEKQSFVIASHTTVICSLVVLGNDFCMNIPDFRSSIIPHR